VLGEAKIVLPLVLIRTSGNRQQVVASSQEATAGGIRVGMTLAQARALCADVQAVEHDPSRQAKALEAMGRWMKQYTPVVALPREAGATRHDVESNRSVGAPGEYYLFLDLTGCDRYFGGIKPIVDRVASALRRLRYHAKLAVAPTPGAAWALSLCGPAHTIVTHADRCESAGATYARPLDTCASGSQLLDVLLPLPVYALRLDLATIAALHHLGLFTIGHVLALPREKVPVRFGALLLLRLDQATGRREEPLVPLDHVEPIAAGVEFDGVVDDLETLWIAIQGLIEQVVVELARRGLGARELLLEFVRAYAPKIDLNVRVSRPSRDAKNLFNLLRCAMERVLTDAGYVALRLSVPASQIIVDRQTTFTPDARATTSQDADAVVDLVDQLHARLGERAVERPRLIESHLPEFAVEWTPHVTTPGAPPSTSPDSAWSRVTENGLSPFHEPTGPRVAPQRRHRPLRLFPSPLPARAIVSPSHDRDGRPVWFAWEGGGAHTLVHVVGPERLCGPWWKGRNKTRDYFDVEDEQGKRFWVFRVNQTHAWYVHGTFD